MAHYTAKDLRNITKDELVELLKKEGIEFDPTTSFFALRALLLNETKDNDNADNGENNTDGNDNADNESDNKDEKPEKPENKSDKPKPTTNALSALRSEIVKRRGGVGLGKSAFAAELAKRRGERVTPITFAQELKSRQLKYKGGK